MAITISFLLLTQSMNICLSDLTKLDDLIEHAQFHKEVHGDDWWAFLEMHLGSEKEDHLHHEHQEEHENLPHHDHFFSTILSTFILENEYEVLPFKKPASKSQTFTAYIEHYSFLKNSDIFQPPKLA